MEIVDSCQNCSNSKTTLEILCTSDTHLRLPDLLALMFQTMYLSLQGKKKKKTILQCIYLLVMIFNAKADLSMTGVHQVLVSQMSCLKKENHSSSGKGSQNKRSEVPTGLEINYFS